MQSPFGWIFFPTGLNNRPNQVLAYQFWVAIHGLCFAQAHYHKLSSGGRNEIH